MKILFFFLIGISYLPVFCYGQKKEKIYVPVLKENKLLKELIIYSLKAEGAPSIENKKNFFSNYVIMLIGKNPADSSYTFSILLSEDEKSVNCLINNINNKGTASNKETARYGYLELNKYKIFVWTVSASELFQTDKSKTFKFVYRTNCDNYVPTSRYLSLDYYKYKDGHFYTVTIPPMR
ncbi:MAG TPA: hypothetical protein VGI43_02040 [Mucilaginibacter sp.]|jgi:hypothetical protein